MDTTEWSARADEWVAAEGPAALVCRQWLVPVEGPDGVVFPPTFAGETGGRSRYNIDTLRDGTKVALIDSVGSQANRMEPLFKEGRYARLVPQIRIRAGEHILHLLDAGHRAADAIVRYSTLGPELTEAFRDIEKGGDARRLAQIAPTSLVFGVWDSRDTEVKLPRLLASTIRAWDVEELTRSAQYNPPIRYADEGLIDAAEDAKVRDVLSQLGFRDAPAAGTPGGVRIRGEIRRETILSFVGLRALGPAGKEGDPLRRYVLALALVAMMHDRPHHLRQGCLLVRDGKRADEWNAVHGDGTRNTVSLEMRRDGENILEFATESARAFGVDVSRDLEADPIYDFDRAVANAAIEKRGERPKKNASQKAERRPRGANTN
ncbi:MAG: type I-U CRISPR-associated protein Cas7 [Chloroflexota bacterium]|nr:type I-U CRISPR-associated protein Cas7 [Chloroflexota bacterium]